jgi:hypothetical protein
MPGVYKRTVVIKEERVAVGADGLPTALQLN